MLQVLEVVELLLVLDVGASLQLLIQVVDAVLKMKAMLQLLDVMAMAKLQQNLELDSIHGYDMTGTDFQNSHS